MVRMSQDWKLREVLIEMHGNNGSMDGDPPAAMRYTEARLSKLSGEMLADIEKETVDLVWNFDDTEKNQQSFQLDTQTFSSMDRQVYLLDMQQKSRLIT